MPDEVLIPVRKADGTVEKITKAEFLARQQKARAPAPSVAPAPLKSNPPVAKKSDEQNKIDNAVKEKFSATFAPMKAAPVKPQTSSFKLPASKINIEPDLETLPETNKDLPRASGNKNQEAEEIINKLNLKISAEVKNRLIGLVQLRLKDVRGEAEVKEWLMRPENQYGIGLDAATSDRVIAAVNDYIKKNKIDLSAAPVLKKSSLMIEEKEPLPSTSSPINSFVHRSAPEPRRDEGGRKTLDDLVRADAARAMGDIAVITPKNIAPAKTIMSDIASSKPLNMGPIDEIRYMTLVDFRRLSANPAEAAARLKQKFTNLQEESYVLFMEALEAWRKSPLFNDYVGASAAAINAGQKISSVENDKNKIQMSEVKTLIQMEKDLL